MTRKRRNSENVITKNRIFHQGVLLFHYHYRMFWETRTFSSLAMDRIRDSLIYPAFSETLSSQRLMAACKKSKLLGGKNHFPNKKKGKSATNSPRMVFHGENDVEKFCVFGMITLRAAILSKNNNCYDACLRRFQSSHMLIYHLSVRSLLKTSNLWLTYP